MKKMLGRIEAWQRVGACSALPIHILLLLSQMTVATLWIIGHGMRQEANREDIEMIWPPLPLGGGKHRSEGRIGERTPTFAFLCMR